MRAPHHNFVVIVPMIMKFRTGVKFDVFYTMVAKKCDVTTTTTIIIIIIIVIVIIVIVIMTS